MRRARNKLEMGSVSERLSAKAAKWSVFSSGITIIASVLTLAVAIFATMRVQSIYSDLKMAQDRESKFRLIALSVEMKFNIYKAEQIIRFMNNFDEKIKNKKLEYIGYKFSTTVYDSNPSFIVLTDKNKQIRLNENLAYLYSVLAEINNWIIISTDCIKQIASCGFCPAKLKELHEANAQIKKAIKIYKPLSEELQEYMGKEIEEFYVSEKNVKNKSPYTFIFDHEKLTPAPQ